MDKIDTFFLKCCLCCTSIKSTKLKFSSHIFCGNPLKNVNACFPCIELAKLIQTLSEVFVMGEVSSRND